MAIEAEKKNWMSHLPGIMGGSAALIAALTTVYVNLRHAPQETASAIPVVATAQTSSDASAAAPAAVPSQPASTKVAFRLERILTQNDGSLGTTDWVFEVDAQGTPLYSLPVKSLDDSDGKNLRMIPASTPVSSVLDVSSAGATALSVKGWKHGLLGVGGAPNVTGQGWLSSGVDTVTVEAKSAQAGHAAFVFYFSAAPTDGGRK